MFDDAARYLNNEGNNLTSWFNENKITLFPGKGQGYDVIICDSSDPVGPADVLFKPEFFLSMREALSPTG